MATENKFRINIDPQSLVPTSQTRVYYVSSVVLVLLMIGVITVSLRFLPRTVPLFFTEPWGEARLVPKLWLYLLPLLSLATLLVNLVIARAVKDEDLLSKTLAISSLVVVCMLLISIVGILQSLL